MAVHYMTYDDQANYTDIYCDGYVLRIHTSGSEEYLVTLYDPDNIGTTAWGYFGAKISESGNIYALGEDLGISVVWLEKKPNIARIIFKGDYEGITQTSLGNESGSSVILTVTDDEITMRSIFNATGSITLDNSTDNGLCFFELVPANVAAEDAVYENSGSESAKVGDGEENSADYIGITSTEIDVIGILLSSTLGGGTASLGQYIDDPADGALRFRWNNGTITAESEMTVKWVLDSADRTGGKDYNSTTRIDVGNQWKDQTIQATPDEGTNISDLVLPDSIGSDGFATDGAFHIEPVSTRDKPATDADDLKTTPDVDGTGGLFEDNGNGFFTILNQGSGDPTDIFGNYTLARSASSGSGPDWIDGSDPDTGLRYESSKAEEVNLNTSVTIGTNDFTVFAKIKADSSPSGHYPGIVGGNSLAAGECIPLGLNGYNVDMWMRMDQTNYGPSGSGTDLGDDEWHIVGVSVDRSGNATFWVDGVLDYTDDVSAKSAVSLSVGECFVGRNEYDAGVRTLDGDIAFAGMIIGQAWSAEQWRFFNNNPYWVLTEGGRVKITNDITRYNLPIVIDSPIYYGTNINPKDPCLNYAKLDDNAASSTLVAEVGPDGNWEAVSDGSNRNTNSSGDSVSSDNFRGNALDTQNGTAYADLAVGSGTVHDNAYYSEGSIVLKITPQHTYTTGSDEEYWTLYVDSNDYHTVYYRSSIDVIRFSTNWNGTNVYIDTPTFTDNNSLQRQMVLLLSWNYSYNFILLAIDGQVIGVDFNNGTQSTAQPNQMVVGTWNNRAFPADMIIDEIKTYNRAILPYGSFHTGGDGLLASIDNPNDNLSWYFDGQAAAAKGGADLGSDKNPTNTGGQFVTTDPILGTNHWDSNGTTNVLTRAESAEDIVDYNAGCIGIWFNLRTAVSGGEYLIDVSDADDSDRISAVFDASGNIDVTYRSASTSETITGDIAVSTGEWHFLKITWDDANGDNKVHSYIDGIENGTAQDIANTWTGGNGLTWYFTEDHNGSNGCDAYIQTITMGKDPNTPEIWTILGEGPRLVNLTDSQ